MRIVKLARAKVGVALVKIGYRLLGVNPNTFFVPYPISWEQWEQHDNGI